MGDPWKADPDITELCLDCKKITPHREITLPILQGHKMMFVEGVLMKVVVNQCLTCKSIQGVSL